MRASLQPTYSPHLPLTDPPKPALLHKLQIHKPTKPHTTPSQPQIADHLPTIHPVLFIISTLPQKLEKDSVATKYKAWNIKQKVIKQKA
ncbi:hypothetical protein BOTCAL_0309g00130 [Botryotinia calthae]|uniref:Uncharacterized protein n=1 Tax=Botryotinia calthae TaxID=38488 RepID=A0A4Y8CWS8_9HELO|nr:hypothetical protein BOTCAL_0309g00130 [Botryotinia calthae]